MIKFLLFGTPYYYYFSDNVEEKHKNSTKIDGHDDAERTHGRTPHILLILLVLLLLFGGDMTFFMDELTHIKLFTGPYCDILRFFVGIEMRRDCRFDWPKMSVPRWSSSA